MTVKSRGVGPKKGTPVSNRTRGEALVKRLRAKRNLVVHVDGGRVESVIVKTPVYKPLRAEPYPEFSPTCCACCRSGTAVAYPPAGWHEPKACCPQERDCPRYVPR